MRRNIELYISNTEINPEDLLELPNYQRVDLFEEQSILYNNIYIIYKRH